MLLESMGKGHYAEKIATAKFNVWACGSSENIKDTWHVCVKAIDNSSLP